MHVTPFRHAAMLAAVVAFALSSLTGCSGEPGAAASQRIVGKWQEVGGEEQHEYFSDGTVVVSKGTPARGQWKFLDDGRLKTETDVLGTKVTTTFDVTFDEDFMTLQDATGQQRFTRVTGFAPTPVDSEKTSSPQ